MDVTFRETSADERTADVALGHLSVELGHVYAHELAQGADLEASFRQVAAWANPGALAAAAGLPGTTLRWSTCFLVDDYSAPLEPPSVVLPAVVAAATRAGISIDYLARESGCVDTGTLDLADHVAGMVVPDPPIGTTGNRPTPLESGWLSNGVHSSGAELMPAMAGPPKRWTPPRENAARRHSVFLDAELWSDISAGRQWSCAFLAAVWQLMRLGLLRGDDGRSAVTPVPIDLAEPLPRRWADLPPVVALNRRAAPFAAYRTLSILPNQFLPVEHAVRTVLEQVAVDPTVVASALRRGAAEGLVMRPETVERISYVLYGPLPDRGGGTAPP